MQRMHCWIWLGLLVAAPLAAGCGSSGSSVEATAVAQAAKDARDPKQVVSDFLDLKRQGNHSEADKLLSDKAGEVTRRVELKVAEIPPDGSVRYEVGALENVTGGAHVETTWTMGQGIAAKTATMLFVLRDDAPGWRIVGVIMRPPGPGSQAIALDFEDEPQLRSFIAANTPPAKSSSSERPPAAAETAAKPSTRAGQTKQQ
jgi:hypothetical protein